MTNWKLKLNAFHFLRPSENVPQAIVDFATSANGGAVKSADGAAAFFHHPLGGSKLPIGAEAYAGVDACIDEIGKDLPPAQDKKRFFLRWRFAPERMKGENGALLPANSALPDYTIWNHLAIQSALASCLTENNEPRPALMLLQLGPVQDFIAQSRSTRDLWSGSYMLSWLMAHAIKSVTDEIGPDAIIYPHLRGNGIFDALYRDYFSDEQENSTDKSSFLQRLELAQATDQELDICLSPTLPNRFLALVPDEHGEELARNAAKAIRKELQSIREDVWKWIEKHGGKVEAIAKYKERFDNQVDAFPQISWAIQPWLSKDECMEQFDKLPCNQSKNKETPQWQLEEYLKHCPKDENPQGALWSAHYQLLDAKLTARRNTRDFKAWNACIKASEQCPGKDSLSGKEEIIGGNDFWEEMQKNHTSIFTASSHRYGAMNLIKRLWCQPGKVNYLGKKLGVSMNALNKRLHFDSLEKVTAGNQYKGKYVAVLAMDGDEMGKWVSGVKTPLLKNQLSASGSNVPDDLHRPLSPAYHTQFSECLANFVLHLASPIVEAFKGELIYVGGDDVLAMLPADRAIGCAEALRCFFTGNSPSATLKKFLDEEKKLPNLDSQTGFVTMQCGGKQRILPIPGRNATVSIGLAIGHCNAPLQMLVKEAQNAEHSAKHDYGRNAIAFSIYKRSGEILKWGCQWDSPALELMERQAELSNKDESHSLSERFPYVLARLLQGYGLQHYKKETKPLFENLPVDEMRPIIEKELRRAIERQGKQLTQEEREDLLSIGIEWLEKCSTLADFIQPFLTETFINRENEE